MFARVHPAKDVQSGNKGSCHDLVHYLQKEGESELSFFSHTENEVNPEKVIADIDGNRSKLGAEDAKFYMLSLNPSQAEQIHLIGREVQSLDELTPEERRTVYRKLEQFTRSAMDEYARNFQREAVKNGGDLMYYARIETKRTYSPSDEVNNFQVSAASTPFLTRQGQVRYKLAAGQPRPSMSHQTENETFFSNEVSWGMLSNTSLYGGLLLSGDDYHSAAIGIGQNMLWLGALSFDVTWASSHFDTQQDERGLSYRFNYSKQVDATNSTISLAAYRFSDRHFHSYANYLDHKYNDSDAQDEKQTISLSVGQPITPLNLNLYANLLHQTWWNADASTTANITAGFNVDIGDWRDISISTSFNTTHYEDKDRDNQIYLSISLPFGNGGRVGYDMQNSSHSTTHRMSWNDTLDERNSWGMSAGLQSDRPDNGAQVSGNYQHLSSAGEWDISGTYAANDYSSVSSSWSGSFTATQYGAAFHRRSSTNEPRLMVSTDGVADIPVQGNLDYTNHFGIAVVPLISSYQPSTVAVNMNDLPDGVTVAENVIKETWIEGAIGYKSLASRSGKDVNVIIRNASGQFPPLGADIRQDDSGISVGMVGEEGHAWLSGVAENQKFTVVWGDSQHCSLHLPEHMEDTANRLILPCH